MKNLIAVVVSSLALTGLAVEREYLWLEGKMPDAQDHQFARMTDEEGSTNRIPYIEWFDKPENSHGGIVIMISGGGYNMCCDVQLVRKLWPECLMRDGFQVVNLCYRTPWPQGLKPYQTAWEDGQRAVRVVRAAARKRGLDPNKIGVIGMSAGGNLAMLLATSSQTPAYEPIDAIDKLPCHVNFAIPCAFSSGYEGGAVVKDGSRRAAFGEFDAQLPLKEMKFDKKTCPTCLLHGGKDLYTPLMSTQAYRKFRMIGVPAELHLYSDCDHGGFWNTCDWQESVIGFIRQLNLDRQLGPHEAIMDRFPSDEDRDDSKCVKANLWPEGKIPDFQKRQCVPYIEWHFPKKQKTKAIQIVYSGGGYSINDPDGFEVTPYRRFLNSKGMTVVTMKYRTPNIAGFPKHHFAWQDLQRAIRMVRKAAPGYGLDPERIGAMGSSAGGHLTLMGALSSTVAAYEPIDELDRIPCNLAWGFGIYPAYVLTDGAGGVNKNHGNLDEDVMVPEFKFDEKSCPMAFVHGDMDAFASMGSVKAWERLREMGIQCDLHTLERRGHCFHAKASPGTGSYTWMNRLWEFLTRKGFNK